ncbi:hypothetical protein MNBD_ALPHA06-2060 [hydrothermal vent metagenome]|uniref:Uncharacterized protein n=1 Tax=hydrothermal vent metagenome TaxID=652676 RepID=A0A3B0RGU8_9ZZZZ
MKWMLLISLSLFWQTGALAQSAPDCEALGTQMKQQAKVLNYQEFEDDGWRKLAAKKCFFQAGTSIVAWLSAHADTASDEQTRTMRYHAARVFAMVGRTSVALIHLKHARNPDQAEDAAQDWNSYMDVFSGWLRRDLADVQAGIARLELQPIDDGGYKPNLEAAQRFLTCYTMPYAAIETDPACVVQSAKTDDFSDLKDESH